MPDEFDGQRVEYVTRLWHSQDAGLASRDRQVEENVRMLAGQQWTFWSDLLGKFVDVSRFMTDEEKRWRQRPVINRLLYWYMLIHARLTENPPVITFQPATGDRIDAELAEVMDTVTKTLWNETGMLEVVDRLMAWLIPGGRAYLKTRIDPLKGEVRQWIGPAMLPVIGPDGLPVIDEQGEPMMQPVDDVPFDENGEPLASLTMDGNLDVIGPAYREYEGGLVVDVLAAPEVRGEWGPSPWHQKRWHLHLSRLPVEQVETSFGVQVEPDTFHGDNTGELNRLLFGAGYFGATGNDPRAGAAMSDHSEGLVSVYELWEAPSALSPETEESPGGRLLIVTKNGTVLSDGPRPARFRYTSPIRCFDFVSLPGRPSGTSPQEMLNPIQRTYNRGWAQILEHRNLSTNPIAIVDHAAGISDAEITNRPGNILAVNKRSGIAAFEYVMPPPLSEDVYRTQGLLMQELSDLGNIEGAEGKAPHSDASGELVKELRFNSDRFVGPTTRRAVVEMARLVEDWISFLPTIWDKEKVITYAGGDHVTRTVTVLPYLWTGRVNAVPEIESMLPEGRGQRFQRITALYMQGVFGMPGSPEANKTYLELSRFPHMGREMLPGGIHRITAEQENGRLVQGAQATDVPVLEWYDHMTHLAVHEEFMSSPEYLKLDPETQQQFVLHRMAHRMAVLVVQSQDAQMAGTMALAQGQAALGAEAALRAAAGGGSDPNNAMPEPAESPARHHGHDLNQVMPQPVQGAPYVA